MFDDLVPTQAKAGAGMFDDLIPVDSEQSSIASEQTSLGDRALSAAGWVADKASRAVSGVMPGVAVFNAGRDYLNTLPEDEREDFVKGVIRSSAKGATLGGYDRVGALMHSAFSDKTYDEELERIRGDQAAFEDENPIVSQSAELVGGVATPGGAALKGAKYVGDLARWGLRVRGAAPTVAKHGGRVIGGMTAGAGFGTAAGLGQTDDLTDLPQVAGDMAGGAALGAALGPALEYGGGMVWNGAKWIGRQVDDIASRAYEAAGGDATRSGVRILADTAEGGHKTPRYGQTRDQARLSAAQLDADVANTSVNGVQNSLAVANPNVAALAEEIGAEAWMPNAPFEEFARRNLGNQTDRVSAGVGEALNGTPTNHRQFMRDLETEATTARDPFNDELRSGSINGQPGVMQIQGLHRIYSESPERITPHLESALDDVVNDSRVAFTAADKERVLGVSRADRALLDRRTQSFASKKRADEELAYAKARLDDARRAQDDVAIEAAQEAFEEARNTALHTDAMYRTSENAARGVSDKPRLLTQNLHPAVAERLYHYLSQAANSGDEVVLSAHRAMQQALGRTTKGRALLAGKAEHAQAFRNRDAGQAGEKIWNSQGIARDTQMRGFEDLAPGEQGVFRQAAAGGAASKVAGDQGTFARPQALVGSTENRETMRQLFGDDALARAQGLIDREGHVHDVTQRMFNARTHGNNLPPDAIANALKMAVQWKFTPSVAIMNTWSRVMRGITAPRGAAIADIALNGGDAGIDLVRQEMVRRAETRARQPAVARQIGARAQALANQLGAYGDDYDPYAF
jgi:hypothetical protein